MPALMRSYTDRNVISRSWKKILPLSGGSKPLMRFTRVVLPAPLEPINDSTSPCSTRKLTWSTAWVSPKDLCNFSVRNRLMSRCPLPAEGQTAQQTHNACGHEQHQQHQHPAEHQLPVHRRTDGIGLEVIKRHGAQQRTYKAPEAPQNREKDNLPRERPPQDIGCGQAVEWHPENTRQACEQSRDHKGVPAIALHAYADEAGARFIVANGLEGFAEGRVHNDPHQRHAQQEAG